MKWLTEHAAPISAKPREAFESIWRQGAHPQGGARVSAKKAVDFAPMFEGMESAWERAMGILVSRYAG
jgi:hypothetical protein